MSNSTQAVEIESVELHQGPDIAYLTRWFITGYFGPLSRPEWRRESEAAGVHQSVKGEQRKLGELTAYSVAAALRARGIHGPPSPVRIRVSASFDYKRRT